MASGWLFFSSFSLTFTSYWAQLIIPKKKKTESKYIMLMLLCYRRFDKITVSNRMKHPPFMRELTSMPLPFFFLSFYQNQWQHQSEEMTTKDKINSRITSNDWLNVNKKRENERRFMLLPVDYFAIFVVCGHFCG